MIPHLTKVDHDIALLNLLSGISPTVVYRSALTNMELTKLSRKRGRMAQQKFTDLRERRNLTPGGKPPIDRPDDVPPRGRR